MRRLILTVNPLSSGSGSQLDNSADRRLIEHAMWADLACQLEGIESLGLANCFSACLYCLADFFLALIHHVLYLPTSVPNLLIGCIYAIQALVRNPLSSLCSGFWSQKYTHCGTDPQSGYQVRNC
jgi:hypothetical protein